MRHLTLLTILLATLTFLPRPAAAQPQAGQGPATCAVVYVLDGDTINCEGGVTIRLLLVDVPDEGEFGEEARAFVIRLLPRGPRCGSSTTRTRAAAMDAGWRTRSSRTAPCSTSGWSRAGSPTSSSAR